ncbi:DUF6538 domain-containing protein [Paraburkholderia sp. GAS42]|uniref:DUF6538 domain-containing protein n=1 Tax=Paraburkholderia sp. GAS42 TaxID=3035135 RepID=UPI003D1C4DA6
MYKRPDSENWQFRRPVPLHLQESIGKPFITESLRTPTRCLKGCTTFAARLHLTTQYLV